jgi:hypothetical protein
VPNIADRAAFSSSWRNWWNGIQPKWRQVSADKGLLGPLSAAKGSDNLNALRKGGASGIVTVLIALKWWAPPGHDDKDWEAAVEDVTSCLQHMTNTSAGTKRKSDEELKPKRKRSKKA